MTEGAAHAETLCDLLGAGFRGQAMLVAGGAGGIGQAIVAQACALGACVVAASRRGAALAEVTAPAPAQSVAVSLDLTEPASIAALARWIERQFGRLDILVNAAGLTRAVPPRALEQLDDDLIDLVMRANATGALRLIRDLAPLLRRGERAVVVTVSSVAARTGIGSNIAYVGAKAAMDAMSIALAKTLAPEVRLVNIAPSALETGFVQGRSRDFLDRTIAATPLKRLATPTEVANAVLCAARLLTATTGATVYVDGGRHL